MAAHTKLDHSIESFLSGTGDVLSKKKPVHFPTDRLVDRKAFIRYLGEGCVRETELPKRLFENRAKGRVLTRIEGVHFIPSSLKPRIDVHLECF